MTKNLVLPFLGSALSNAEKEAMAGILYEAMRFNGKNSGEKIYYSDFVRATERMSKENRLPTIYRLQNQNCWNAVWEMVDEGFLLIHDSSQEENEEAWMIVTDDLAKLVSPDISNEVKKEILARAEISKKKAEEKKAAEAEEKKIKAEEEKKKNSIMNKIRKIWPF